MNPNIHNCSRDVTNNVGDGGGIEQEGAKYPLRLRRRNENV